MNKNNLDYTPYLMHFIKCKDYDEAFSIILNIITDRVIRANTVPPENRVDMKCVCLTESPLTAIIPAINKINTAKDEGKPKDDWQPFGFKFKKEFIFKAGGLPVIYQPYSKYEEELNELNKWRHMTFYPLNDGVETWTDVTYEREWRIKSDLNIEDACGIILPNKEWRDRLYEFYQNEQDCLQQLNLLYMDDMQAWYSAQEEISELCNIPIIFTNNYK